MEKPSRPREKMRKLIPVAMIGCIVLGLLFATPNRVHASTSITPYDLINLINDWRVNRYGFAPLTVNSTLMGTAQYTAQFMADNHLTDHMANLGYGGVVARITQAGYQFQGFNCATENWASSVYDIGTIASYWEDEEHQYPASKEQYKNVGAGVAVDSAGVPWYIIHAACATSGSSEGSFETTYDPNSTREPTFDTSIHAVVTSTPQSDGGIYHIVEPGQALWSIAIAYNTTIEKLKKLNGLTDNNIWAGKKLLIMQAPTSTVSPTVTLTPIPPTRTPTHPITPKPPTATITVGPSPTSTKEAAIAATSNRHNLGLIIIVVCGIGLLAVIAFTFSRKPSKVPSREKER
jgi:LysM repeat protein